MTRNTVLKRSLIVIALFFLVGYGAFEARRLVTGPVIAIDTPRNGATITEGDTYLEGNAENVSKITLNGRGIFITEEGRIHEPLVLLPGYNKTTLTAWDRFGKKTDVVLELVYKPHDEIEQMMRRPTPLATSTNATST